jgi:amino acid permease
VYTRLDVDVIINLDRLLPLLAQVAILFCNLCACICFVNQSSGEIGVAYTYFINLSGVSTFIVWAVIILTHIQFRRGLKAQEVSINELPFRAMWYPYGAYFGLGANIFLIFFKGYTSLLPTFLFPYFSFCFSDTNFGKKLNGYKLPKWISGLIDV